MFQILFGQTDTSKIHIIISIFPMKLFCSCSVLQQVTTNCLPALLQIQTPTFDTAPAPAPATAPATTPVPAPTPTPYFYHDFLLLIFHILLDIELLI